MYPGLTETPSTRRCPVHTYLSTQLEVGHHYGNLRACDDEDDKDEKQEAKEIVELVLPNGRQDEEQLHKDSSKWENTCN